MTMLALLLSLSAQPAAIPAAPEPVREPVALPPPVEERLLRYDRRLVRTLVHTIPGELPARRPDQQHSIAIQRWIGARIAAIPAEARVATFTCAIAPNGQILATTPCETDPRSPHAAPLNRIADLLRPWVDAGEAPATGRGRNALPMPRAVRFTLRLDPAGWPEPWAPRGLSPPTGVSAIALHTVMQRRWQNRYPAAALRAGANALVVAECGVEADRSISCRTLSITPPDSEPYFRGAIENEIPWGRAPETLSGGHPTPELEFRVPLRFMMAE